MFTIKACFVVGMLGDPQVGKRSYVNSITHNGQIFLNTNYGIFEVIFSQDITKMQGAIIMFDHQQPLSFKRATEKWTNIAESAYVYSVYVGNKSEITPRQTNQKLIRSWVIQEEIAYCDISVAKKLYLYQPLLSLLKDLTGLTDAACRINKIPVLTYIN